MIAVPYIAPLDVGLVTKLKFFTVVIGGAHLEGLEKHPFQLELGST